MKILFFCPTKIDPKRGAARTLIGLAAALEEQGCRCTLMGPPDLNTDQQHCAPILHQYLLNHAAEYDVIDFDYKCLNLDRQAFSNHILFVARSQLLRAHYVYSPNPPIYHWRDGLRLLKHQYRRFYHWRQLAQDERTFRQADLVTVMNQPEKQALTKRGVSPEHIVVFPGGLSRAQQAAFAAAIPPEVPPEPVVAFVGAFGLRKGSAEFPDIVRRVAEEVTAVHFRFLGTGGTADQVLSHFPTRLRQHIEVIPTYEPEALPALLAPAAVGVFPSYADGFGYGVLEMLAAGLPVVAYDAPGPAEMLPPQFLVPIKDSRHLSQKLIALLQNQEQWTQHHLWARQRAAQFTWEPIAARTHHRYSEALARKRGEA